MSKKLDAMMEKVLQNHMITSIRRGLLQIVPLTIVGSFALVALNLPIAPYQDFMNGLFGEGWRTVPLLVYKGTYEIMSLAAAMSIAYTYCQHFEMVKNGRLNSFSIVLSSMCAYFAFNPLQAILIDADSASSRGMLGAILVAIVSTRLYVLFWNLFPNRRDHYSYDSDSLLKYSFRNVAPLLAVLLIFALTRALLGDLLSGITEGVMHAVNEYFFTSGGGFVTVLVFILVIQLLWFFGLHGTNMLDAVAKTLFVTASDINIMEAAAGEAPTQIFTKQFLDGFVFIGGAGCTLGLIIALAAAGRRTAGMEVAKYSILPGIININETLVYGLPIIFNPYYFVPFLAGPILSCMISYAAFSWGLVPLTTQRVDWTTPIFLSGYVMTGSFAGALLRWYHPVYGYISPLVVSGLCEEADLGTELGSWVIDKAYEQLAAWDREGLAPLSVSVNMSPQQLRDDRFLLDKLLGCIKKTGIAPMRIELELTEHAAIDQSYTTRNRLEQIKEKGMNLSIDDFGMGNSSLLYIKDFGVNVIKIDMSLVREITTNVQSQEIVRSIISLSQQLNIEVVAEGVETEEQLERLAELDCKLYQGFYFSQAVSSEEFTEYMKEYGVNKRKEEDTNEHTDGKPE